jgi:hypothetical protein
MRRFGPERPWGGFGSPVTGAPYTATRTITHVQVLANGTTISHVTTEKEARDSQGRTFRETNIERGENSIISYSVFDPVSRTEMNWTSKSKQVTLVHLPELNQFRVAHEKTNQEGTGTGWPGVPRRGGISPSAEQLGSKIIDGVTVEGTRTTFSIPAGKEGNNQPLTITHESWISSDLKLLVLRTDSDPRSGTTTNELSNIDRNEPDAKLFQAPEGYTVQERGRDRSANPNL